MVFLMMAVIFAEVIGEKKRQISYGQYDQRRYGKEWFLL